MKSQKWAVASVLEGRSFDEMSYTVHLSYESAMIAVDHLNETKAYGLVFVQSFPVFEGMYL